jgi:hypothetical protein
MVVFVLALQEQFLQPYPKTYPSPVLTTSLPVLAAMLSMVAFLVYHLSSFRRIIRKTLTFL